MATEKQEMQKELELQLHEQFAINNNANSNSFVAMLGALIIAFTGYGYVLYQFLMGDYGRCCCQNAKAQAMVHIATIAVLVVILILYVVAVHIGASQRSDQFVIHKIRGNAYAHDMSRFKDIYGKGYSPVGKSFMCFVQGFYNSLSWMLLAIYSVIAFVTWGVVLKCCCLQTVAIILLVAMLGYRLYKFAKYLNLCTSISHEKSQIRSGKYFGLLLFPACTVLISVCVLFLCNCFAIRNVAAVILSTAVLTMFSIYFYLQE